ncbi:MAG: metal-sulfur cluster assembly factor [Dehalococcoidia bacterium]
MTTAEEIRDTLKTVFDPEIGVNIVDLGLIYGIEPSQDGKNVKVTFTLTTPACPVGPMLQAQIVEAVAGVEGVEEVETELVFSPPWDPREMCSDEAKFELGIF